MSELRTARPSSANGGTTTTSKPRSRPSAVEGVGRPPPLEAERRVRGHQQAGERRAGLDRGHERVIGRSADGVVEVLDDGDRDPGVRQALQALVRMHQQRRRRPRQHLVGMGVERDDGRIGRADLGFADEVLEEVGVAAVQAIEHADDREDRPVLGPEGRDPVDDLHQAVTTDPTGVTRTLSGARRPPGASIAIAAREPSGARSR